LFLLFGWHTCWLTAEVQHLEIHSALTSKKTALYYSFVSTGGFTNVVEILMQHNASFTVNNVKSFFTVGNVKSR
jgi:hypothetical protein